MLGCSAHKILPVMLKNKNCVKSIITNILLYCGFTFYTWGPNRLEYLRGTLKLRCHFETPCGSYMGGNILESMQQWSPSNLTGDATFSPEDIRRTGDLCCSLYYS